MKKITLVLVALLFTSGIAFGNANAEGGSKATKIGVALYQDAGSGVNAVKTYLYSIAPALNVEYVFTVLSMTDEATNLSKIQELIASGVKGIITTMDMGSVAIVNECRAAGVYIGGYLVDFESSYNTAYDAVFKNKYFVGAAADGPIPSETTIGKVSLDSIVEYNGRNPENPVTHVSMVMFPSWAFPGQAIAVEQFVSSVEEYNKTADVKITVDPLDEVVDVLPFTPLNSTYFTKHPGINGIVSFAAGNDFVYPTMVSSDVTGDIKLFTVGYSDGVLENFGSNGDQTIQQFNFTTPESITFPLVLLLNKINKVAFPDQPEFAERYTTSQIDINSDEDMAVFVEKSIYYSAESTRSLFTGEEVLNMTAYANPDATYADLKAILASMTIEDLK